MIRQSICVRTSFVGFHHWPDAPSEVSYLRTVHRHKFNVEFFVQVGHGDRQLEFHQTLFKLNRLVEELACVLLTNNPAMSCEMMAQYLHVRMKEANKICGYKVIVSEDGEHDGIYEEDI